MLKYKRVPKKLGLGNYIQKSIGVYSPQQCEKFTFINYSLSGG